MTRKKFVKMCMSFGFSRNEAVAYANQVRTKKGAYKEGYKHLQAFINLTKAFNVTGESLRMFGEAIGRVVETIKQFSNAIMLARDAVARESGGSGND